MKTRIDWVIDDETRARIRAFYGRGGLATRVEIRRFVLDELEQSKRELPEAKRRRPKPLASAEYFTEIERNNREAIPPTAVCKRCGKSKAEHVGRRLDCPLSRTVRPGSRFEQLTEVS